MTKKELVAFLIANNGNLGLSKTHMLRKCHRNELERMYEACKPKQQLNSPLISLDAFASRRGILIASSYYRSYALGHNIAAKGALIALSNL